MSLELHFLHEAWQCHYVYCMVVISSCHKWNWSNFAFCDDAILHHAFNHAFEDEIWWPTNEERLSLGAHLLRNIKVYWVCWWHFDWNLQALVEWSTWFNGWKKIYAMNNIVIMDRHGLFIYIDIDDPDSYHDVTILRHSNVYKN
jgi:hypothetical protein